MSTRFAEYVTSTAFNLQLSKAGIAALNSFRLGDSSILLENFGHITFNSLWRKGLIDKDDDNKFVLSQAGEAVMKLLELADLLEDGDKRTPKKLVRKIIKEFGKPSR